MTKNSAFCGCSLLLCVLLVGCSTTQSPQQMAAMAATPKANADGSPQSAVQDPAFLAAVNSELDECERNADGFGLNTKRARNMQLGIATVGIIAGSIIVPALAAKTTAARSTIAAWGGVSGAANAGQAALTSSGYSPQQAVAAQRAYVDAVASVLSEIPNVKSGAEAASFLLQLRFVCRIALPITDATAPEQLQNSKPPQKPEAEKN